MKQFSKGLLLLLSIILPVSAAWSGSEKQAKISPISDSWDFGFVPMDYRLIHFFRIKNEGDSDLRISKLIANCDCTTAEAIDTLVPPDSSTEIKITFYTKDYYGQNTRNVTVHTNDPETPTVDLKYSSNIGIIPKLYKVEPRSLFFLRGHESKEIRLLNFSEDNIPYELFLESDSIFAVDRTEGKVNSGEAAILNITPLENLPRGTHYSSFIVSYGVEPEIRISVPVKIVRY